MKDNMTKLVVIHCGDDLFLSKYDDRVKEEVAVIIGASDYGIEMIKESVEMFRSEELVYDEHEVKDDHISVFPTSIDASDWANSFMNSHGERLDEITEDIMLGWFNAVIYRVEDSSIPKAV